MPTSVQEFLQQLDLERYWNSFDRMGFDKLDTLQDLKESTLTTMEVALGYQGKLLCSIKKLVEQL
jgi:hypothetical protein